MSDKVINGCLNRIRQGDMSAVGPLADYLEETEHSLALTVRKLWEKWYKAVESFRQVRKARRCFKLTVWEEICLWHRFTRSAIRRIFKRKWRALSLKQLCERNLSTVEFPEEM